MRYYRCKCGDAESWSSMGHPKACCGCKKCNTTLEEYPEDHKPREEHDYSLTKYDTHTGKPYKVCSKCYRDEPESFKESQNP